MVLKKDSKTEATVNRGYCRRMNDDKSAGCHEPFVGEADEEAPGGGGVGGGGNGWADAGADREGALVVLLLCVSSGPAHGE